MAWSKTKTDTVVVELWDADATVMVANGDPTTVAYLSEREARGLYVALGSLLGRLEGGAS